MPKITVSCQSCGEDVEIPVNVLKNFRGLCKTCSYKDKLKKEREHDDYDRPETINRELDSKSWTVYRDESGSFRPGAKFDTDDIRVGRRTRIFPVGIVFRHDYGGKVEYMQILASTTRKDVHKLITVYLDKYGNICYNTPND